MDNNPTKKTLLQRYGIPLNHLDFGYIRDCKDAREMEKIVHILRSNEEGYFPELTQCAEDKLKELKPQSRLFRIEEPIKGREALNPNEIKPIYEWNHDIKTKDKKLKNLKTPEESQIPPIRQMGRIIPITEYKEKSSESSNSSKQVKKSQRIKSTDYSQWDKYDVEEEILRLDLAEERAQEEVERKNRINAAKFIKEPLQITEMKEDLDLTKKWSHLTDIEREKLSEEYRLRGNEYFRAKEFHNALNEYTRSIEICPEKAVAAYNNRALTYFKQQKFLDSIADCEKSLKLEPNNLKARLRLAEASYAYGRRRESYQLYNNVLQLDAENTVALKAIEELRKQFEDLPPPNATRLLIQDQSSSKNEQNLKTEIIKPKPKPKSKSINYDYDLADLVKPNRIVKNKLMKAAETLTNKTPNKIENDKKIEETDNDNEYEIRLPGNLAINKTTKGKKLIEEI